MGRRRSPLAQMGDRITEIASGRSLLRPVHCREELGEAMLFHVTITVRMPHEVDPNRVKQLRERERERAAELQRQGKWLHLWRLAGKRANVSIFDVESPAELHELLE